MRISSMWRLGSLALVVLAGCFSGRAARYAPISEDWKLNILLAEMDDVQRKLDAPPPPVRQLVPASASPVYRSPRTGRIHARVMFAGGHLQLVGLPERSRSEIVLAVRPVAALDSACDVRVYRDGKPVTIGERKRQSDHELAVVLPIEELGPSARFRGTACGQSFELDAAGRDTLASFVARFHERIDELSAAPTTTVAKAR